MEANSTGYYANGRSEPTLTDQDNDGSNEGGPPVTPSHDLPDGPQEPITEPASEPELEPAVFAASSIRILKNPALDQRLFLRQRLSAVRQQRIKTEHELEEIRTNETQIATMLCNIEEYISQCDMLAVVSRTIEPLIKSYKTPHTDPTPKEARTPRPRLPEEERFSEQDLLKILEAHPNTNLSPLEVVAFAPASKRLVAKKIVYVGLIRLVNKGLIQKVAEGVYRLNKEREVPSMVITSPTKPAETAEPEPKAHHILPPAIPFTEMTIKPSKAPGKRVSTTSLGAALKKPAVTSIVQAQRERGKRDAQTVIGNALAKAGITQDKNVN